MNRKLSIAILAGAVFAPLSGEGHYINFDAETPDGATDLGSCPLGSAFLGSLFGDDDRLKFYRLCHNSSRESITDFITIGLYQKFPQLNQRASTIPGLVSVLRRELPEFVPVDAIGRRRDPSVFAIITQLDRKRWSKQDIAQFIGRNGL